MNGGLCANAKSKSNPLQCALQFERVCRYSRSGEQLEDEDAERPVVHRPVVALVQDDLGRHVLGRAAERPRLVAGAEQLGEAKVDL